MSIKCNWKYERVKLKEENLKYCYTNKNFNIEQIEADWITQKDMRDELQKIADSYE